MIVILGFRSQLLPCGTHHLAEPAYVLAYFPVMLGLLDFQVLEVLSTEHVISPLGGRVGGAPLLLGPLVSRLAPGRTPRGLRGCGAMR